MTVALIANYLGPKLGIGQYIDQLIQPLVRSLRNESVDVVVLGSPNAVARTPSLRLLQSSPLGTVQLRILPQLDESPAKRFFWFACCFTHYCKKVGIDQVVWLSNPIVMPWHPPTIAVIHDVNEWKAGKKYGSRLKTALRSFVYLEASLRYAKKIVVVSNATAADIIHFRDSASLRQKLRTIPNGSNSTLRALPSVTIRHPRGPFVLSVGRIDPASKRLPEAVDLVLAMREISAQPWELHILGGMNTSTQSSGKVFLKTIESLPWVDYHGHVSDAELAEWYRCTDAVVFLSDNEGFGLPVAEAAHFNRWAIVSSKNAAGSEAGSGALITVDAHQPDKAASRVLHQLREAAYPPTVTLSSWQDAALAYAREIESL
ncbi:MAG: glycosyltransferase [Cyanobacteria bacterium P01_D01_bin.36]